MAETKDGAISGRDLLLLSSPFVVGRVVVEPFSVRLLDMLLPLLLGGESSIITIDLGLSLLS